MNYVRCKECGHIYSEEENKCPSCGKERDISVNEDVNVEPVFNIND